MDKTALEALVRQVLLERLGGGTHGVKAVQVPRIAVTEEHRMDTGNPLDRVYTRDLFTLQDVVYTERGKFPDIRVPETTSFFNETIFHPFGQRVISEGDRGIVEIPANDNRVGGL